MALPQNLQEIQKRTGAFQYYTCLLVIEHAKWRKSRGKRPSMPLHIRGFISEPNPAKALDTAQKMLKIFINPDDPSEIAYMDQLMNEHLGSRNMVPG